MKILQAHIKGYRYLVDVKADFDDLTALASSRGAQKKPAWV